MEVRSPKKITVPRLRSLIQAPAPRSLRTSRRVPIGLTAKPRPPRRHPSPRWEGLRVNRVNALKRRCTRNRQFPAPSPDPIALQRQQSSESSRSQRPMPILRGRELLLRVQVVSSQLMFQSRLRRVGVSSLRNIGVPRPRTLIQTPAPRVARTNRTFRIELIVEPRQHPNPRWEGLRVKRVNGLNRHRTRNRQFQ